MSEMNSLAFTDKELQICSELAYLNFTKEMENKKLRELFYTPEKDEMISFKLAMYTLYQMIDEGKADEYFVRDYMRASQKILARQFVEYGLGVSLCEEYAGREFNEEVFGLAFGDNNPDLMFQELDNRIKGFGIGDDYREELKLIDPLEFDPSMTQSIISSYYSDLYSGFTTTRSCFIILDILMTL